MQKLSDALRRRLELALMTGPLTRSRLLMLGLTDPDIRRLVRNEDLRHMFSRYVAGWTAAEFAAVSAANQGFSRSVLSHFTAARLHELRTWVDSKRENPPCTDAIWITRPPRGARREKRSDVVLRTAGLTPADHHLLNRVHVTTAARTAVDLARELPLREALVTMDHVLAVHVERAELVAVIARQTGWPGVRKARAALALADPRSESVLESIARAEFAAAGLPKPVLQASFWAGTGWTNERVDFWWPQFGTFAEADGLAKYEAGSAKERRRLMRRSFVRDQKLADLGLEYVRFGWEDAVVKPKDLAGRLRAAFDRGSRRQLAVRWREPDPSDIGLYPALPEYEPDAS
jgi:hypothetical protein